MRWGTRGVRVGVGGPFALGFKNGARSLRVVFVLGHLGFSLLGARLARPLWSGRFPVAWLLFGALLPDLIDKPLGHFLLPWDNGRIFAHTFLFVLLLGVAAWWRSSRALSGVTLGVFFHHVLDRLPWGDLETWFWPMFGGFEVRVSSGVPAWVSTLLTDPYVWVTESLGLVLLVVLLGAPLVGWLDAWWEAGRPLGDVEADLEGDEGEKAPAS